MITIIVLLSLFLIASLVANWFLVKYLQTALPQLRQTVQDLIPKADAIAYVQDSVDELVTHTEFLTRSTKLFQDPEIVRFNKHCRKVLNDLKVFRRVVELQKIDGTMELEELFPDVTEENNNEE